MTLLIHPEEHVVFDIYFASVVSMNDHPGQRKEPSRVKTLDDCAIQAMRMLAIRRKVLSEEKSDE